MMATSRPKLKGGLIGVDGNAFVIMGTFQGDARRAGWSEKEIAVVLKEAKSSTYEHLLSTIAEQYENPLRRRR